MQYKNLRNLLRKISVRGNRSRSHSAVGGGGPIPKVRRKPATSEGIKEARVLCVALRQETVIT